MTFALSKLRKVFPIFGLVLEWLSTTMILAVLALAVFLYWEDSQQVMSYVDIKEGSHPAIERDLITTDIAGYKKQGECEYVKYSGVGYAIIDGYKQKVGFKWLHEEDGRSFDGGLINPSTSFFSASGIGEASQIGLSFEHICHGKPKLSKIYWIDLNEFK